MKAVWTSIKGTPFYVCLQLPLSKMSNVSFLGQHKPNYNNNNNSSNDND